MASLACRWCVTLWLCLAGHAVLAQGHGGKVVGWPLAELAEAEQQRAVTNADGRPTPLIEGAYLRVAWAAAERMLRTMAPPDPPEILITDGVLPNAFAFTQDRRARIVANFGMLRLLGDDAAAWAALWGHELAHLVANHGQTRSERKAFARSASDLIGLALIVAGIPVGDMVADGASTLVERGYSRDEERAADRLGVEAMVRAGFDPAGAVRLQEALASAGAGAPLPFLSTHPGSAERVESMRALVREIGTSSGAAER